MLKEWVAVALGGMLGAIVRHGLSSVFAIIGPSWLPVATLVVNVVGCFAIGTLAEWAFHQQLTNHYWVIGARVGVLGGLTTFSSFGLDVVRLWNNERTTQSLLLLAAHVVLGLLAVAVGMACARIAFPDGLDDVSA